MSLPRPDDPRFTYGDYVQWHGDERWELIEGRAYLMSPAPSRWHQQVLVELLRQTANAVAGCPCRVYVAPFDVRLPRADEADADVRDVVQPDLVVVCDDAKLDDAGCRGAPDWVVEILSPSTTARDRIEKRDLYERAGVREYWVVDLEAREVTVHHFDATASRFREPVLLSMIGRTAVSVVPGLEIDWTAVFAS